MREGTAPVIRREDYAAPAFWIRRADLVFDLEPAKTLVASRLEIERTPDRHPDAGTEPLLVSTPYVGTYLPPAIAARLTFEAPYQMTS